MSRGACNIAGKVLIFLVGALILSLPLPAHASGKTLVLFPLTIYADQPSDYLRQGVKSMLVSRLSGGGLEILCDEAVESVLGEEGITSKEQAEELARALKGDYALFGSITTIGGGYSLDLSLLELGKDGSRLITVSEAVGQDQFIPKLSEVAYQLRTIMEGREGAGEKLEEKPPILPKPVTPGDVLPELEKHKEPEVIKKAHFFDSSREYQDFRPTGKISVDMAVMAFDMGDLDGDRLAELVVVGRKKLLIYQRKGETFVLRDSLEPGFGEDFLKVSVGDTDKNGRSEIYLVSRYGQRARTTVLEWAGEFKRLDRRIGHMQAIRDPGGSKSLLLFQDSKVDDFFSGSIYVVDYDKGGELKKRQQLPQLREVEFYSLTPFDLDGDGDPEFLGLGKESRLYVWDKQGEVLWSTDEKIGGTNNAIKLGELDSRLLPISVSFNSRVIIRDIDGDGNREILAIKNQPFIDHLGNFKFFRKSSLIAYRIEGTNIFRAWQTRDINYCLTDIQADAGSLYLAGQKGKLERITRGSGSIMWFE
jgi:hypothetical protein